MRHVCLMDVVYALTHMMSRGIYTKKRAASRCVLTAPKVREEERVKAGDEATLATLL